MSISVSCKRRRRAILRPSSARCEPSRYGSFSSPFQPTVVRGFSKKVRMTTRNEPFTSSASVRKRRPYSSAAAGS
jgi:hypothetical protein